MVVTKCVVLPGLRQAETKAAQWAVMKCKVLPGLCQAETKAEEVTYMPQWQ